MLKIKKLSDKETAKKIGEFLTGANAFDQTWAPNEKALVTKAVVDSLNSDTHQYWYVEDGGEIVAAMGIRENKYGAFYQKHGYQQVVQIPNYYVEGEGRIDFFKQI